ncbi:WD40-repeat-containing domain protein [Circinella umbellata]|nr:WD40-repeat-containing domain protein [Circinella umbellata]
MVTKTEKSNKRRSNKKEKQVESNDDPATPVVNGGSNNNKQTSNVTVQQLQKRSLVVSKTAGGKISDYPIVFTKDSRYLFACTGSSIKIYSVATGAALKVLSKTGSTGGHTKMVTNVALNPKNPMQLYSASLDGTIKLWDYNDDVLLKTFHVRQAVEHMVICPNDPDYVYLVTKVENDDINNEDEDGDDEVSKGKNYTICRYYLGSDEIQPHKKRRVIVRSQDCFGIDVSTDGKYLAIASRSVLIWPVTEGDGDVPWSQFHVWPVQSPRKLKFSPMKHCLAVGNDAGELIVCYFTPDNLAKPRLSNNQWHHTEIRALHFMADGIYVLTGGDEAVLVFWQLETGFKQFLPRLGGEINSISVSPDHKYYCVGLADNSIRLINSITQKVDQVIQGLQYGNKTPPLSGLVVEPRYRNVVLNGVDGSVQFYNPNSDAHVAEVEVVPVSRNQSSDNKFVRANVQHAAFLANGEWMATVDKRDDFVNTSEQHLKFWRWDPNTQSYALHTRVDKPHAGNITSITFNSASSRGGRPMAITTSDDKTFKVWHFTSKLGTAYDSDEEAWTCRSIGLYRRDIPEAASFSTDGSILAVAFGSLITLWDPYENCIRRVLAQSYEENVNTLRFVGDSPYLLAASKTHITVWNMLTCTVWWSYKIKASHIAVDTLSTRIAVVCNNEKRKESLFALFDAKSATPVALRHSNQICNALTFIPRTVKDITKGRSDLICLTEKLALEIISVVDPSAATAKSSLEEKDTSIQTTAEPTDKRLLDDIFGKRSQERNEKAEEEKLRTQTAAKLREQAMQKETVSDGRANEEDQDAVLGAPSHALPSVEAVFDTFMGSLMKLRISDTTDNEQVEDAMDIDEEEQDNHSVTSSQSQEHISESFTLEELPSLNAYFADLIKPKANNTTTSQEDPVSSDTDDSDDDEEDPNEIDW